jgi:hypothetical protein
VTRRIERPNGNRMTHMIHRRRRIKYLTDPPALGSLADSAGLESNAGVLTNGNHYNMFVFHAVAHVYWCRFGFSPNFDALLLL